MAFYDPVAQRVCVRIVYDGAGGAGKTTNLRALAGLLATQQVSELVSPGEAEGRTLYFDWLEIRAGAAAGLPLLCQVISVPGQTVLTPRRRHLLAVADVVVLVCDSDAASLVRAREGLARVAEPLRDVPLVVQANKQDAPGALPGAGVLAALGRELPVVEAIATDGVGVVDTFLAAVRLAVKAIERCEEAGGRLEVRRAAGADELRARLDGATLDPEWAAEMFLEEAQAAFLLEGSAETAPRGRREAPPTAPTHEAETGFVWPATRRELLAELAVDAAAQVSLDAEGRVELAVGDRWLRTARSLRFEDRELAREALVRAAREWAQLDGERLADAVLAVQAARDGAYWLWTTTRRRPSLASAVTEAAPDERGPLLGAYGRALATTARLCLASGISVALGPACFALHGETPRFAGANDDGAPDVGSAVVAALDEVRERGWDAELVLGAFEAALAPLTPEEVTRIAHATGMVRTTSPARDRLAQTLARIAAGGRLVPRAAEAEA